MTTPGGEPDKTMDPKKVQEHFEDFYEDLFEELSKYGEIDSLDVYDNLAGSHGESGGAKGSQVHVTGACPAVFHDDEGGTECSLAMKTPIWAGRHPSPFLSSLLPDLGFCRAYLPARLGKEGVAMQSLSF